MSTKTMVTALLDNLYDSKFNFDRFTATGVWHVEQREKSSWGQYDTESLRKIQTLFLTEGDDEYVFVFFISTFW
jgi:hypothetical protein